MHQLTLAGAGSAAAADRLGAGNVLFDATMRALDEGSSDTLVFERPCHGRVSDTEALWLATWRLVLADRLGAAIAAIRALVDAPAASTVLAAMVRASAKLNLAA